MAAVARRRSRSRLPDGLTLIRRGSVLTRNAAALGIVLLTGAAGLPGVGPHKARVSIDVAALPWAAVARVQIPGISRCTGFLVGPQTVITAAHCLYGRRLGHFAPAASVHVLLGYADGIFTRHAVAASYRIADGYNPLTSGGQGADVAVLALEAPIGGPGEGLALADQPSSNNTALMLGGYGQDRAERIAADLSCKSLGYGAGADGRILLAHDCAGTRGTSGGPVLVETPTGWRVAGVQVAGNTSDVGGLAVPAAAIRALLARP